MPVAPPVTAIQATLLVAVHEQLPPAVTLTDPEFPPADTETLLELRLYVQVTMPDP